MSERIELRVHDFLAEGRDESKSHVLLEIAQPAANEVATHGHFFAIAELAGATPKTIQMVRAWIEFAIESYYKSVPTNVEHHFEAILGQLNTQSSLYLKQHAHEQINMAVAVVCNTTLYIAVHGHPAALLFYRKDDAWRSMSMVDPESVDQPGQLFSNVVTGAMRIDDQFLLATPRVTEFFSADRLAKISEGKTMGEVNDHMLRILNDMSSDYSFAGVWLRLVRTFDETKEIMQQKIAGTPAIAARPEKKSDSSMSDLLNKTRDTASILAPPVLTIPKDKIITNILKLAQKTAVDGGKAVITITHSSVNYIKANKSALGVERIANTVSVNKIMGSAKAGVISRFTNLPNKRKYSMFAAIVVVVIAVGAISTVAFSRTLSSSKQETAAALSLVRDKIHAADESFTYQNEDAARTTLSEAETLFAQLSANIRTSTDGAVIGSDLADKHNKILHIVVVSPVPTDTDPAFTAQTIVSVGAQFALLSQQGDIMVGAKKIGTAVGAHTIYFDESNKRIVAGLPNRAFKAFSLDGKKTSDLSISWLPEDVRTDAATFYSGRLYTYDGATQLIYRYDGKDATYDGGKRWITDSGKPVGVTELSLDNSVWMKTDAGAILKYTAGKLQPFKINGVTPDVSRVAQILTSGSGQIYFLDVDNHRIVQTTRDGKLVTQFVYPETTRIKQIAIDKNEANVTGVTDDGHVMKFSVK